MTFFNSKTTSNTMKLLALLPLLLFASCVSRRTAEVPVKPLPAPKVEAGSVRFAEIVRAYHVGRYVDPNHPDVMHEHHPVYRVEAYTRWNLNPGRLVSARTASAVAKDAAYSPPPTNDVVLAELNRQKDATERVMWEASRLARSHGELQKVLNEMSSIVTNHVSVNSRLSDAEHRVAQFETELQRLTRSIPVSTNEGPSHSAEEQP